MNTDDVSRLIAELELDIGILQELEEKNKKAQRRIDEGGTDELDWAALGYTIHNIYNAVENYCMRVAKFFENRLSDESWHKDLITRMTVYVEDVRPALLDRTTANLLHELRAFRHVFRNIYQTELDSEKVSLVQKKVHPALERFYDAHSKFIDELREIRDELE